MLGYGVLFNYGKSYLERVGGQSAAMPIYEPELPLRAGAPPPSAGLTLPGCIRDAALDAWGRRVISVGDTTTKALEPGESGEALEQTALWLRSRKALTHKGKMARLERFELPTNWFEASYSIQLSYRRVVQGA